MKKAYTFLLWLMSLAATHLVCGHKKKYYFALAADTIFFEQALHLIGTLHKFHIEDIEEIAFFDLGLLSHEREILNSLAKVTRYNLVINAKHMLMPFPLNPLSNKPARGHYTWKAAVLKQALEMFPYVIYIDAGVTVVGKLDCVFEHIQQHGYFFIDSNQTIEQTLTQRVRKEFFLDAHVFYYTTISANFMGVSRRIHHAIVLPLYTLAQDLALFIDDGTAPNGYGWSRHDQTLLSILIRRKGLRVIPALSSARCSWTIRNFIIYSREAIDLNAVQPYLRYR